jgi:ferredoxin, 2Fe-2S
MADDQRPQYQVKFQRGDESWTITVPEETTLFEAARIAQAPVETLCHGIGACVRCKVRVVNGELMSPTPIERDRLGNIFHITGERLACQARVLGPIDLDISVAKRRRRSRHS